MVEISTTRSRKTNERNAQQRAQRVPGQAGPKGPKKGPERPAAGLGINLGHGPTQAGSKPTTRRVPLTGITTGPSPEYHTGLTIPLAV